MLIIPILIIYGAVYSLEWLPPEHIGTLYIIIHLCASGVMFATWRLNNTSLKALLIIGIVARVLLIATPDITSNDSERYLWDGAVAAAGFDPYTTPPDSHEVAEIRELWPTPAEHVKYATIYPPASIALFAIAASAGPNIGPWVWKAMVIAASIASLLLMAGILARRKLSHHLSLFALSPLLILEAGVGAHIDTFSVLAICAAIFAFDRARWLVTGLCLGIGAAIKFFPIVIAGPLILASRPKDGATLLLGALGFVVAIYATAFSIGYTPIGIIGEFLEKWRFGSPIFTALESLTGGRVLLAIIVILAGLMLLLAAIAARRNRLVLAMTLALATPLTLSPAVFPWYLCLLVPMLALRPSATLLAWVTTAPMGYIVLNGWLSAGVWQPASWTLWVIAGAVAMGLSFDLREKSVRSPEY